MNSNNKKPKINKSNNIIVGNTINVCFNLNKIKNTKLKIENNNHKLEKNINTIIKPFFEDIEKHLITYIENASYVIGCIAWLTNDNILEALSRKKGVKIIVNKEEFLNPEMEISKKYFYRSLHEKYNKIPNIFNVKCLCCKKIMTNCPNFNKIFNDNTECDSKNSAILTCGIVNTLPKMHHKFLIFFNENIQPYGVWTGSYNLSKTSNFSLENALFITDKDVVDQYLKEFMAIYPHSENYYWKSGSLFNTDKK
ncbi:putative phospholipase D/nuclease [Cotonvirus japonicus]|uniref:Phospholipase D/nuclease n=1 Tax=Cotonvirus japonicus TaxID=2811091 RepID=A0ABM7NSN1_9VIRU|nr:putative phospholipase D/nuclease [Cotonvirus japonicus]BCS83174.1 putative phospholipase D/nuclease [Cotonvirus japonicus]